MSPDTSLISTLSGFNANLCLFLKKSQSRFSDSLFYDEPFCSLTSHFQQSIKHLTVMQNTNHADNMLFPPVEQTHFNLQHSSMEVQTGDFQTDFLFLGIWWDSARTFCPDGARRNQTTDSVILHLLHPLVENLILCGKVKKKWSNGLSVKVTVVVLFLQEEINKS